MMITVMNNNKLVPKFYCASSLNNRHNVKLFIEYMKSIGYECTFDWTVIENEYDTLHLDEIRAIDRADFVVVLLCGGRGTHFELGYSVGKNKKIYIWDINSNESYIPFYKFARSLDELLSAAEILKIGFVK